MGKTLQPVTPGFNRSLRVESRADRLTGERGAVLLTERSVPSQITICGMVNEDRFRVITFDDDIQPDSYVQHVLGQLPKGLPFFGDVTGFAVNYTPDHATIHDRDGRTTDKLDQAYQLGTTRWWV